MIERQSIPALKSRLVNALQSLTSANQLSTTLDRKNYQNFRKNLNKFLIDVRGFLRTMWCASCVAILDVKMQRKYNFFFIFLVVVCLYKKNCHRMFHWLCSSQVFDCEYSKLLHSLARNILSSHKFYLVLAIYIFLHNFIWKCHTRTLFFCCFSCSSEDLKAGY